MVKFNTMQSHLFLFLFAFPIALFGQLQSTGGPTGGGYVHTLYANDNYAYVNVDEFGWRTLDGGNTWEMLTNTLPVPQIGPRCWAHLGDYLYMGCQNGSRCYRSANDGDTWETFNTSLPDAWGNPMFVASQMLTSGDRLFFGGTNFGIAYINDGDAAWSMTSITSGYVEAMSLLGPDSIWINMGGVTYASYDNGDTFNQLPSEPLSGFGLAATDFIEVNGRIVACTNGGGVNTVYYSDDMGTTWVPATTGFAIGYRLLEIDDVLYGIGHDGIYQSTDQGENWNVVIYTGWNTAGKMDDWMNDEIIYGLHGNGVHTMSEPATANTAPASITSADVIAMVEHNNNLYSLTAQGLFQWTAGAWVELGDVTTTIGVVNNLVSLNGILYLCTGVGLYGSTNNGVSFEQIDSTPVSQLIQTNGHWLRTNGGLIQYANALEGPWNTSTTTTSLPLFWSCVSVAEHNGAFYLGGFNAYLISTDNGATFSVTSDYNAFSNFISFDGAVFRERVGYDYLTIEIQKSTDNGTSWTPFMEGIQLVGFNNRCAGLGIANGMLVTYRNDAGNESLVGVTNTNATWQIIEGTQGPSGLRSVPHISSYLGDYFVAFDSNGIWKNNGDISTEETNSRASVHLYPNPFVDDLIIDSNTTGQLKVYHLDGRCLAEYALSRGMQRISTHTWAAGAYVFTITQPKSAAQTFTLLKH
jgi:hypothetical protein